MVSFLRRRLLGQFSFQKSVDIRISRLSWIRIVKKHKKPSRFFLDGSCFCQVALWFDLTRPQFLAVLPSYFSVGPFRKLHGICAPTVSM